MLIIDNKVKIREIVDGPDRGINTEIESLRTTINKACQLAYFIETKINKTYGKSEKGEKFERIEKESQLPYNSQMRSEFVSCDGIKGCTVLTKKQDSETSRYHLLMLDIFQKSYGMRESAQWVFISTSKQKSESSRPEALSRITRTLVTDKIKFSCTTVIEEIISFKKEI